MAQTAVPTADGVTTNWQTQSGGSSNLYSTIADASDATYIASPTTPSTCRFALGTVTDPANHTAHTLTLRLQKNSVLGDAVEIEVRLYLGGSGTLGSGTLIATLNGTNVPGLDDVPNGWVNYSYTLSEAEAAAISSYSTLYVEIERL